MDNDMHGACMIYAVDLRRLIKNILAFFSERETE